MGFYEKDAGKKYDDRHEGYCGLSVKR